MKLRLNRYLSLCGLASRRKAEILIESGEIIVNGVVEKRLQRIIDSSKDEVFYKNNKLIVQDFEYYKMNKPRFFLTTMAIEEKRKTVLDLLPKVKTKLFPIGRLDYDTEGLLLFTNNGDLANKLMHPSSSIMRTYNVSINRVMNKSDISKSLSGLNIGNREVGKFQKIKYKKRDNIYEVSLTTGKNREIRRIFNTLGFRVKMLHRIKYGDVSLNDLKPGKIRYIKSDTSNLFFY